MQLARHSPVFVGSSPLLCTFKLNFDTAVMDGKVGIGAIVCDANGDILLTMNSYFALTGSVELAKVIAMLNGISKSLEVGVSPLWVESDSRILSNLLVGNCRFVNETQAFVDVIFNF